MATMRTLWEVWKLELPGEFSKSQAIEELEKHWGVNRSNVILRLKSGRFDVVKDLSRFYSICFIGFNQNVGFFFDRAAFEASLKKKDFELADSLGLSI